MHGNSLIDSFMSDKVACCHPDSTLEEAAKLMVSCDCGSVPVTEKGSNRLLGIITDRDITCRAVAKGRNPLTLRVKDVMSSPVISAHPDNSLEECCELMEQNQIRRLPVTDKAGHCVGIVAQADIALEAPPKKAAEMLHEISMKSGNSTPATGH